VALVEGGRLDAQSPQVNVSLAPVMDLVVDDIKQAVVNNPVVLAEGPYSLVKTRWRNLRPQGIDLFCAGSRCRAGPNDNARG
jgi:hypothetical protein